MNENHTGRIRKRKRKNEIGLQTQALTMTICRRRKRWDRNLPIWKNRCNTLNSCTRQKIPFNKIIGFEVETYRAGNVAVRFVMKPELIGNYVMETLHGGVISSVLDATGG